MKMSTVGKTAFKEHKSEVNKYKIRSCCPSDNILILPIFFFLPVFTVLAVMYKLIRIEIIVYSVRCFINNDKDRTRMCCPKNNWGILVILFSIYVNPNPIMLCCTKFLKCMEYYWLLCTNRNRD